MLTVVIPCYNEAEGVPRIEAELFPVLESLDGPCQVIAVNDGSDDATGRLLAEAASRRRDMRVLSHHENRGLGAALRTGLSAADGDWLVFLDADLTFHPRHIPALVRAQRDSGADCVSGSPSLSGAPGVPLARRLPSLALNAFYRGLFDRRLTSYTPMFRLYRTAALRAVPLRSDGFEISVEILVGLLRAGRRVIEIPVPLTVRGTGESKLRRWRELANHAALAWRLLRPKPPY
ncbi:MAG: glycosyltransferase family 2 protein [Elusimicrobiota bacterium]